MAHSIRPILKIKKKHSLKSIGISFAQIHLTPEFMHKLPKETYIMYIINKSGSYTLSARQVTKSYTRIHRRLFPISKTQVHIRRTATLSYCGIIALRC